MFTVVLFCRQNGIFLESQWRHDSDAVARFNQYVLENTNNMILNTIIYNVELNWQTTSLQDVNSHTDVRTSKLHQKKQPAFDPKNALVENGINIVVDSSCDELVVYNQFTRSPVVIVKSLDDALLWRNKNAPDGLALVLGTYKFCYMAVRHTRAAAINVNIVPDDNDDDNVTGHLITNMVPVQLPKVSTFYAFNAVIYREEMAYRELLSEMNTIAYAPTFNFSFKDTFGRTVLTLFEKDGDDLQSILQTRWLDAIEFVTSGALYSCNISDTMMTFCDALSQPFDDLFLYNERINTGICAMRFMRTQLHNNNLLVLQINLTGDTDMILAQNIISTMSLVLCVVSYWLNMIPGKITFMFHKLVLQSNSTVPDIESYRKKMKAEPIYGGLVYTLGPLLKTLVVDGNDSNKNLNESTKYVSLHSLFNTKNVNDIILQDV